MMSRECGHESLRSVEYLDQLIRLIATCLGLYSQLFAADIVEVAF